jgi:hypothetical protein
MRPVPGSRRQRREHHRHGVTPRAPRTSPPSMPRPTGGPGVSIRTMDVSIAAWSPIPTRVAAGGAERRVERRCQQQCRQPGAQQIVLDQRSPVNAARRGGCGRRAAGAAPRSRSTAWR